MSLCPDLTSSELEAPRRLAIRPSRCAIGQQVDVSLNSVKAHQRILCHELDVEDRNTAAKPGMHGSSAGSYPTHPHEKGDRFGHTV